MAPSKGRASSSTLTLTLPFAQLKDIFWARISSSHFKIVKLQLQEPKVAVGQSRSAFGQMLHKATTVQV
jgi:hypothetical protein